MTKPTPESTQGQQSYEEQRKALLAGGYQEIVTAKCSIDSLDPNLEKSEDEASNYRTYVERMEDARRSGELFESLESGDGLRTLFIKPETQSTK